jgi:catechol 2,3-dioxygenase-like lactoylglutathione lyase family enzyme
MIDHIDHIVLTTRDKAACIRFYTDVLGMKLTHFKTPTEERLAFSFGEQKINLHEWGREFEPLDEVVKRLGNAKIRIIEGPVRKTGAVGPIRSVYVRDPDLNLVEISVYES